VNFNTGCTSWATETHIRLLVLFSRGGLSTVDSLKWLLWSRLNNSACFSRNHSRMSESRGVRSVQLEFVLQES
jgi:hypothetical protein